MTPRGIRNNNPGNIRIGAKPWRGQIGNDGAFCIFDEPENGIRAIAYLLSVYRKRGIYTIGTIIPTWAPATENNTEAYIQAVCRGAGLGRNDYVSTAEYPAVIAAIIQHENGQQPYTPAQILEGIGRAVA